MIFEANVPIVEVKPGTSPLVLSIPHSGVRIPKDIHSRLNENGKALIDTDWWVHKLYEDLLPGVTIVKANFHSYVIDPNRDPSGKSLYPGQNTTDLIPMTDFHGREIWQKPPTDNDIQERLAYHSAYHEALYDQLHRVRLSNGVAVLYDCHSIASKIPNLFKGRLDDFNIGTNSGKSCSPVILNAVNSVCKDEIDYSTVVNGHFKGGWTTRHYGNPDNHIHAIQMELAQSIYLKSEKIPFEFDSKKAEKLRLILTSIFNNILSSTAVERQYGAYNNG